MQRSLAVVFFLWTWGCGPGIESKCTEDCAGTLCGAAVEDACGICDADPSNDCNVDCLGVAGGHAAVDECGNCDDNDDNDCVEDCAGDWGGTAAVDMCGTCDVDTGNDCVEDCAGDWGGSALLDNCGACDTNPNNDCEVDCAGTWGGTAVFDMCGTCDANAANDCTQDCNGSWGGSAALDNCGTCDANPGNDCVQDCHGNWGGAATVDVCGQCDANPGNDCFCGDGDCDAGESAISCPTDCGTTTTQVCYPGANLAWTTCVDVIDHSTSWGADYAYPAPLGGSAQYAAPLRFVDLSIANPGLALAPNFVLSEFMQEWKGRYAIYQPHVVDYLQDIRNSIGGSLIINSGYRSVAYNASVGGATNSRHMYGDAADVATSAASFQAVSDLCYQLGAGYVDIYTGHVHCDWRNDPLEPVFFSPVVTIVSGLQPLIDLGIPVYQVEMVPGVVWTAPTWGWDEGEPLREWTAWDVDGNLIAESISVTFVPPEDAAVVEVWVSRKVVMTMDVP